MGIPFSQMSFPEIYERSLVQPLFRPFAEHLIEITGVAAGERVLDVACGTGIVARLAKERVGVHGAVVGVDVSPPMIAVARAAAPAVDYREGNAMALPLHDGEQFNVVVCHQGLQFFPDRSAAVREMHRSLKPGGRLGVGTWRPDEEMPILLELRRIAERHLGPVDDRRHSFGDANAVMALLREAGYRNVESRSVWRTVRFDDGLVFVRLNAMAMAGMSAAGKDLLEDQRAAKVDAIVRDSAALVKANSDSAGFKYDLGSVVVTALR
jgi:ubiquinone/menaquinone biosynthesis C-methylase UbiE